MSIIGSHIDWVEDARSRRADRELAITVSTAIKNFVVKEGRRPATAYFSLPVNKLYQKGSGSHWRTVVLPPGAERQNPDLFYGVLVVDDAADAELII